MSRRKLLAANTPFFMIDPDPNDFFTIHPSEHATHLGTFTNFDEGMIAGLVHEHPEADEEEIRLVVRRSSELGGEQFLRGKRKKPPDSWRLALAERLMESGDEPSRWLLEEAAKQFVAGFGTKVAERWRRERRRDKRRETRVDRDRKMIDELAKELKAEGVRASRLRAKEQWARMQNITIHALKQRRSRDPSRGTRQRRSKI